MDSDDFLAEPRKPAKRVTFAGIPESCGEPCASGAFFRQEAVFYGSVQSRAAGETEAGFDRGSPSFEDVFIGEVDCYQALGCGLLTGFANADAGSLLFVAQMTAQDGTFYLALLAVLIIPLYFFTELVTRLAVVSRKTLFHLLWEDVGKFASGCFFFAILFSSFGAVVLQVRSLIAVGGLLGFQGAISCFILTAVQASLVMTGNHRRLQTVGIVVGGLELLFLLTFAATQVDLLSKLPGSAHSLDLLDAEHGHRTNAVLGLAIVPWLLFFQSSAVTKRCWTRQALQFERVNIALGACSSQLMKLAMCAIVSSACLQMTAGRCQGEAPLAPFVDFVDAMQVIPHPLCVCAMAILGSAFVTVLVACLTFIWTVEQAYCCILGERGSSTQAAMFECAADHVKDEGRTMKLGFTLVLFSGCVVALFGQVGSLVDLSHWVSSLALAPTLLAALVLSNRRLSAELRPTGARKALLWFTVLVLGLSSSASCVTRIGSVLKANTPADSTIAAAMDADTWALGGAGVLWNKAAPPGKVALSPSETIMAQDREYVQPLRYGFAAAALIVAQMRFLTQ